MSPKADPPDPPDATRPTATPRSRSLQLFLVVTLTNIVIIYTQPHEVLGLDSSLFDYILLSILNACTIYYFTTL